MKRNINSLTFPFVLFVNIHGFTVFKLKQTTKQIMGACGGGTYSEDTKNDINAFIAKGPVVVFSASYCPYSKKAKEILKPYKPEILEVDHVDGGKHLDEYKMYLAEITGAGTWPRVFIGGKCIGGCDDTQKLLDNGELEKLINQAKHNSVAS